MATAPAGILASAITISIFPLLTVADPPRGGETIRLPGVEISEEGIKLPGVTVDENGVRMPGVVIDGGGVVVPGVVVDDQAERGGSVSGKRFVARDLRGHDFSGQNLAGAVFSGSDLRSASFTNANLEGAIFTGCDLRGARLSGANLKGAKFKGDDLRGAALRNACLVNAKIVGNDLDNVDFTGAVLVGAKLVGNDMGGATTSGAIFDGPATCSMQVSMARPSVTSARDIKNALSASRGKVDLTVNFAYDTDEIKSEGHVQIMEIADALKSPELDGTRIRIEGHTDSNGEHDYNMDLSYRRAITVMRTLAENYEIPGSRFEVKGYGEGQPIASNDTDEGRALNRRVTLVNIGN